MKKIIPSIIAKNQKELNQRIEKVKNNFSLLQLDVMDGKFVKNKSLNFDFKLPKKFKYEAHLMMKNPLDWIKKNGKKVNLIILHVESDNLDSSIKEVRKLKKEFGIAINPKTSLDKIKGFKFNQLLIMSVNPGKYGAKFLPSMLKKIKKARKLFSCSIEVDGGISDKTIQKVSRVGADKFVVGSYIQKSKDIKKSIHILNKEIKQKK